MTLHLNSDSRLLSDSCDSDRKQPAVTSHFLSFQPFGDFKTDQLSPEYFSEFENGLKQETPANKDEKLVWTRNRSSSSSVFLSPASLPVARLTSCVLGLQKRVCPVLFLSLSMVRAVLEKSRRMSTVSRCSISDSCTNSCCVSTRSCTDCASASRD